MRLQFCCQFIFSFSRNYILANNVVRIWFRSRYKVTQNNSNTLTFTWNNYHQCIWNQYCMFFWRNREQIILHRHMCVKINVKSSFTELYRKIKVYRVKEKSSSDYKYLLHLNYLTRRMFHSIFCNHYYKIFRRPFTLIIFDVWLLVAQRMSKR